MRTRSLVVLAVLLAASASAQAPTVLFPGVLGEALLDSLRATYTPTRVLDYSPARDALYGYVVSADGELCGVYSGFCVQVPAGTTPRAYMNTVGMNTEHTWPQSYGASGALQGEMHNLFPTRVLVNSDRGNDPFGEIPDAQTQYWYRGSVERQSMIPTTDLDAWSEDTSSRFEPRDDHKGNAARAVFYFYAIHARAITASGDAFFAGMRDDLLAWNEIVDPVDDRERGRSTFIASRQGNENPFVLDPTLARRAYAPSAVAAEGGPAGGLHVAVFPNPTAGRLVLEAAGLRGARVEVFDALGRLAAHVDAAADRATLDLGGRPAGLYVVRVTDGGRVTVRRVAVVRP